MTTRRLATIAAAGAVLFAGVVLLREGCGFGSPSPVNEGVFGEPVICFGDSLVAGIGAESADRTYVSWLQRLLGVRVVGFGAPGETAADGLARLGELPQIRDALVVVTLGGNDVLRQVPWPETAGALEALFRDLQERGCLVAFTAVEGPLPGSRGRRYRKLCRRNGVILVPDVLEGILTDPTLKADPIHPNGDGYRLMAERVAERIDDFVQPR